MTEANPHIPSFPDFKIESLRSPVKKFQARKFENLFRNLTSAYDVLRGGARIDPQQSGHIQDMFINAHAPVMTAHDMILVTWSDVCDKVKMLQDATVQLSRVKNELTKIDPNAMGASRKIFKASKAFTDYAEKLTRSTKLFASDAGQIGNMDKTAKAYLELACPDLREAARLGTCEHVTAASIHAAGMQLFLLDIQDKRPFVFGRAYEQQPIV